METGFWAQNNWFSRQWTRSWKPIQPFRFWEKESENACNCIRPSQLNRIWILRIMESSSQTRSSGLLTTQMSTEWQFTRLMKEISPPSPSTEPSSFSIQEQANSSWKSFIQVFGLDKSVSDSWQNGKLQKRWQLWSDASLWKNNQNKLSWQERACWIPWKFIFLIFRISSSRAASSSCPTSQFSKSKSSETESWKRLSLKCCSSICMMTGWSPSRVSQHSADWSWFWELWISIQRGPRSFWCQRDRSPPSRITSGRVSQMSSGSR